MNELKVERACGFLICAVIQFCAKFPHPKPILSCGSQRRKIPRFLGHCTPPDSHKNSGGEPVKPNGGTFVTRRYAYCSWKTFSERACEATKKLHLYLVSKFLLQIDTASCLEVAEKLELYVEHQLNRSFYIVVDCETFFQTRTELDRWSRIARGCS